MGFHGTSCLRLSQWQSAVPGDFSGPDEAARGCYQGEAQGLVCGAVEDERRHLASPLHGSGTQ